MNAAQWARPPGSEKAGRRSCSGQNRLPTTHVMSDGSPVFYSTVVTLPFWAIRIEASSRSLSGRARHNYPTNAMVEKL